MLFLTRVPLRCGRNKPVKTVEGDSGRSTLLGVDIISADKQFRGAENVPTLLRGTECRPGAFLGDRDGWFVVEREDNLDEVIVRTIDGPFATEQEAELVAGGRRIVSDDGAVKYLPPAIEAPELVSMPDDVADLIAAQWTGTELEEVAA